MDGLSRIFCIAGAALFLLVTMANAFAETGIASFYGNESGSTTASGEHFNPSGMTCARPSYRAGRPTYMVRVTVLATGRTTTCRVNDRGPADRLHRIIDLSIGTAKALGVRGLARVRVERLN